MKGTRGACGACSTRGVRVGRTDQPEQRGEALLEQDQEYARHRHRRTPSDELEPRCAAPRRAQQCRAREAKGRRSVAS
jgi:hypothetical protein